tara:strand:+ start:343 stop:639 length:297 start_codon:yes stop_codon:yes gene_type:complete
MFSCVFCNGEGGDDFLIINKFCSKCKRAKYLLSIYGDEFYKTLETVLVRNKKQREYKEDCIKKEKLNEELDDTTYFIKKGKSKIDLVNKELEEKFKNK